MKKIIIGSAVAIAMTATSAMAMDHMHAGVWANDQDTSNGTVTAKKVTTDANGWLVVHRTDESGKPGVVVGHAPLKEGNNKDVTALLTDEVESGDHLMLMVHSEAGGKKTGVFEYSLGAKTDGPIRKDGKLVKKVITAK